MTQKSPEWQEFEKTVGKMLKAPPQPKKAKKPEEKKPAK